MLNEYAYCPRLAYLEWVQNEFADSVDTVEGRADHKRVDRPSGALLPRSESGDVIHARSVRLSDETLGLTAVCDLVEAEGMAATPVDYKHGKAPDIPEGAWEPERVQVCAQGLLLRANGYECTSGVIYYVASKRRVTVDFDDALVSRTKQLLAEMWTMAERGEIPPPLVDSPKCPRCSLVGICLPDETNMLSVRGAIIKADDIRRLVPARDDALPVYVQTQGATVAKSGDVLEIKVKGEVIESVRLMDVSHVAVSGNVQVTTQALRELCERGVPITYFTYGGWFSGMTTGMPSKNVDLRYRQFAAASNPDRALAIAQQFVFGKVKNCRTMLQRNHRQPSDVGLAELDRLADLALVSSSMATLLGIEGAAATTYFAAFDGMIKTDDMAFDFRGRNRRPPRDPVNAVLSLVYSMLVKQVTIACLAVGFDPYLGFYHRPKYGRPALALDLMEEMRPLLGDSVCIGLINNGELTAADFIRRGVETALTDAGRKTVVLGFERRLDQLVTHPLFGYSVSYRRVIELQARLLARHLFDEMPTYPPFRTR